jgi:hypothetical protein
MSEPKVTLLFFPSRDVPNKVLNSQTKYQILRLSGQFKFLQSEMKTEALSEG